MWWKESVFYHIYPLGFCGAPQENDGILMPRIMRLTDWIPHLKKLGVTAVYLGPVFDSDAHGYDTRDYFTLDPRLGTNEDMKKVCRTLHENGIRVILDGVFHHVGRGFFAFCDLLQKGWDSPYKDWFFTDFGGTSPYGDGLWYEGWEGHYNLVKLNLRHPAVKEHLFSAVRQWMDEWEIDGLRLDVAYSLDWDFLKDLRRMCTGKKPDFFLLGELLHGDYNRWVNDEMLYSATNYECYKGLYSAFNSMNLFEIVHSLIRQFGSDPWTLYRGKHLYSFADNHDVSRIASLLQNPKHLAPLYGLLFGMPGIPSIYYGSEWGAEGRKEDGDAALRPFFDAPHTNELTHFLSRLIEVRKAHRAFAYGDFRSVVLTNRQCVFCREAEGERIFVAINADEAPCTARFDAGSDRLSSLLTGETLPFSGELPLPPYSVQYLKA